MKIYKKGTAKPYSFLIIENTLETDDLLCFKQNHLKRT